MELLTFSETLFAFILGAVMGSFGNVLIYRLPKGLSVVSPRSACPECKTEISFYHNIPIISWFMLRGRCAYCRAAISAQYPTIEFSSAALFALIYMINGFTVFALATAFSFWLLLILSAIDRQYKEVPDSINIPAFLIALFSTPFLIDNLHAALLLAGGLAMLRYIVSWTLKKEAMGEGDIIVAATMGALLGIEGGLFAIFLGNLLALPGALYGRITGKEPEIPFIPYLALGTLLTYLLRPVLSGYLPL